MKFLKKLSPGRIIALGFAATILIGSLLLMLPCSVKDGVHLRYIDSLYTSTSAVCVTGLIAVDAGDTFTAFGQLILGSPASTAIRPLTHTALGEVYRESIYFYQRCMRYRSDR